MKSTLFRINLKYLVLGICMVFNLPFSNAQFTEQTSISLTGMNGGTAAWGDYDKDGDLDILLTGGPRYFINDYGYSYIYRNNGNNTFQLTSQLRGVDRSSCAWGDFSNDNYLDLVTTGVDGSLIRTDIYLNNTTGYFDHILIPTLWCSPNGSIAWSDYDNDGDLDIWMTSGVDTRVYRNDGNRTFTSQPGISLIRASLSGIDLGDFDNDGDLDILVNGYYESKLYRNNGDNTYAEQPALLSQVSDGSVAWGDYNNDGFLDILQSGYTSSAQHVTKIYKNNADGTFTEQTAISLPGVSQGRVAWGDYDNDGYIDILLTGGGSTDRITKVFHNNGNNSFTEFTGASLTGVNSSYASWGDYDNDGDLDILLSGWTSSVSISRIYKNEGSTINTPADAPANLRTERIGDDVVFKWDKATDAETPQNGLSYNIFVYKIGQKKDNYRSPEAFKYDDPKNGRRLVAEIGNIQYSSNGYTLKGLQGNFRWSVQAIDGGLKGGYFAPEDSFSINYDNTQHVGVNIAEGILTNTNGFLEYSFNSTDGENGNWFPCTYPKTMVDFGTGGFDIWVRQINLSVYKRKVATVAPPAPAPTYSIDFIEEKTSQIISAADEFSLDASMNELTTGSGTQISIIPGQNVYFRTKVTATTLASDIQTLIVPNRPEPPANPVIDDSLDLFDWIVNPGFTDFADYEYTVDNGKNWTTCPSKPVYVGNEFFAANTVQVRIKSTTSNFTSLPLKSVAAFVNSTGTAFTELTGLSLMNISDGSGTWGDYDNDGYMDIILTGSSSPSTYSRIYHNNQNNTFTQTSDIIPGIIGGGNASWGDYNNDGNLDYLLTGWGPANRVVISVGQNNRPLTDFFTEKFHLMLLGGHLKSAWGDYDNDGKLDFMTLGNSATALYHNNGDNTFTEKVNHYTFKHLDRGNIAWGDYDNDGDLDLLIFGVGSGSYQTLLYTNNGNNTFTQLTGTTITRVERGTMAWGDYNNDGFSDIVVAGWLSSPITKIYKNNGDNTFTEQTAMGIAQVSSSAAWGDYNNDGYLDLLVAGYTGSKNICKLYMNNGDETFTDQKDISPTALNAGNAAWGDCDADGDLDLLLTGYGNNVSKTIVYRNNCTKINTVPSAPANLRSTVSVSKATFEWDKSTDNETPQNGLSYNIRVGKTPGGIDVVSPMSASTNGFRKIPSIGNAGQTNTNYYVKGLAPGVYYWSVQAIDHSFAGGPWSEEASFEVINPVTVSTHNLSISAGANSTASFDITSNISWEINSDQYWLKVNVASGSNNGTITTTASENPYATQRSAIVTVSADGVIFAKINVTQEASQPFLTISTDNINVSYVANTSAFFNITSNTNWNVSSDQSWIRLSTTAGSNNRSISLYLSGNPSTSPRTAIITVAASGVTSQTVTVTQAASPAQLSVSVNTLNMDAGENSMATFGITSNIDWNVSSDQPWLLADNATGSNNDTIVLTATENPSTSSTRTATITVSVNEVTSKTITVTQAALPVQLSVSVNTLNMDAGENSMATFGITSNIDWNVSSDQSWLLTDNATGSNNGTIVLNATENPSITTRTAIITVSASGVTSQTVTVTQAASPAQLSVSVNTLNMDAGENSMATFSITSNIDWNVSSDQPWLLADNATGSNNDTIVLTATENPSITPRTAIITVSASGVTSQTVTVTQAASPAQLSVSVNTLNMDAGENSIATFSITSNIDWNVSSNQPWLLADNATGSNNGAIVLTATENPSITPRTAIITVSGNGITSKTISVTQAASPAQLSVSVNTLDIDASENSMATFGITSNIGWNVSSDQPWLLADSVTGSNNGTIVLTATENPSASPRSAIITVSGNDLAAQIITITQKGGSTGLSDIDNTTIKIYPNPANASLFIKGITNNAWMSIYDIGGKMILNKQITDKKIDVSNFKNGIYTIIIEDNNEITVKKFVKQ